MGNVTVDGNRCLEVKPVSFRMCSSECPYLMCLNQFCHLDNLGSCEKKCCENSRSIVPEYLGPLLRYRLFEESCCKWCKSESRFSSSWHYFFHLIMLSDNNLFYKIIFRTVYIHASLHILWACTYNTWILSVRLRSLKC